MSRNDSRLHIKIVVRVGHKVLSFQFVVLHFLVFFWVARGGLPVFKWFRVVCNEDRDCPSGCAFSPYLHMQVGVCYFCLISAEA